MAWGSSGAKSSGPVGSGTARARRGCAARRLWRQHPTHPAAGPPPPPSPTPEVWTESVCAALVPVVARLTAAPGFDLGAPEATRQAYLTYLDEGLAVTDRARAELAAAGPAPVPDGDVIAEQVRGDVADLRTDLAEARDQVQRTDTGSTVAFGRALVGVTRVVARCSTAPRWPRRSTAIPRSRPPTSRRRRARSCSVRVRPPPPPRPRRRPPVPTR